MYVTWLYTRELNSDFKMARFLLISLKPYKQRLSRDINRKPMFVVKLIEIVRSL